MSTTTPTKEKHFPEDEAHPLPRPFIMRRLHSLLGIWLVLYLIEHLLVNSQAGVWIEDNGEGFISMVNKIHALPYLRVIEIVFLGVPLFIHGLWGVIYVRSAKYNSFRTDGTSPSLPQYKRNHAYTWQRITSWILLFGILAHVVHMRFISYPASSHEGTQKAYFTPLSLDSNLPKVARRLHVELLSKEEILNLQNEGDETPQWIAAATKKSLKQGEVMAISPNAGTAFLLILRQTFKSPLMVILYTILVVATCYHAFNGIWTSMITWGVTLSRRSQRRMRSVTTFFMILVTCLGLLSIWGTFFITRFKG